MSPPAALPANTEVDPSAPSGTPSASTQPADVGSKTAMPEGRSRFLFTAWAGPDLPVWTYVPPGIDAETAPILFVMHGAKRDPKRYLEQWVDHAQRGGFIVIAPEFAKSDFPTSRQYNRGNIKQRGTGRVNPREQWSFSAIEPLFDQVVSALGGQQHTYTLYGHSAGSQFVHRFVFTMPGARVSRYLPANAGWYTFPDQTIDYPYGLKGLGISDTAIQAALAKDVVVLLGDQDTDTRHSSLRRTEQAMRQGQHRFARGRNFYAAGKKLAEEMNTPFNWSYRIIPGVAHSNGGIAQGAHDLVE